MNVGHWIMLASHIGAMVGDLADPSWEKLALRGTSVMGSMVLVEALARLERPPLDGTDEDLSGIRSRTPQEQVRASN